VATNIFNPNGVASGARRGFNPFRVDDFRRTVTQRSRFAPHWAEGFESLWDSGSTYGAGLPGARVKAGFPPRAFGFSQEGILAAAEFAILHGKQEHRRRL
jgi:hypothetical protein